MPPETQTFSEYQATFAERIRNPRKAARPSGAPARGMRVYEELLFNNLEGFLLACYPVTRKILGARTWKQAVRRFFSEQRCHSPLFRDIPKAFLDWIKEQGTALFPTLPFLAEFMHYEWLELHVSISPDEPDMTALDPDGDLLLGRPALNPSAQLACYHYPVHQIAPRRKTVQADAAVYCYLLFRDATDAVRFILLNPLSVQLLRMIRDHQPSGREALAYLAAQTEPEQYPHFVAAGADLLNTLRHEGALLGIWRDS